MMPNTLGYPATTQSRFSLASRSQFAQGRSARSLHRMEPRPSRRLALRAQVGANRRAIVRPQRARERDDTAFGQHAPRHQHRLGRGGRAVVHTGVGDLEAGQLRDERLKFEDRLRGALAGLGLIGRVAGRELGARGHRADHRRHIVVVVTAAEKADEDPVRAIALPPAPSLRAATSCSLESGRERDSGGMRGDWRERERSDRR